MKKLLTVVLAAALVAAALCVGCAAEGLKPANGDAAYMRMSGVEGMSRDTAHQRWMDVVDYDIDSEQGEDGKHTIKSVTFIHLIEPATTRIIELYKKNAPVYDAQLQVYVRACGKEHILLDVYLRDARIADTEVILLEDGTVAETVTLTAKSITYTQSTYDPYTL